MLIEDKYFRTLSQDELWQRYCGFLDLSIDEFMDMQKELLMDEIERVANSILGKKIMGNNKPKSVEEFRRMVPLTTYDDYEPYLSEKREDVLAIRPETWCHSAGRGGQFKWLPVSSEFLDKSVKNSLGCLILAAAKERGQVNVSPGFRVLMLAPPPPYASGVTFDALAHRFSYYRIPPVEASQKLEFQELILHGFHVALKEGVDGIFSIASILARMGDEFEGRTRRTRFSTSMLHPKIVIRLLRAWLRSKRGKRGILPKDLWPTKIIMTGGLDTTIYKNDIARYWGNEPYEIYPCAECFLIAIQTWNRKGMVFVPDLAFFEFIPQEERHRRQGDEDYQPSTVLFNEVQVGKSYEVVITQFYGLPLLRYRMKDIIKVISLRDEETGVNLPHIVFQHRVGETIDLAGLAQLDEKTLWQAVANTGVKYIDWIVRKEYEGNQSSLHLYIELREQEMKEEAAEIAAMVDEQLKIVDTDYKDIHAYLQLQPVRVTLLSPGTFQRYIDEKVREGADLAHLKPMRMNPPQSAIERLLRLSKVNTTDDKSSF